MVESAVMLGAPNRTYAEHEMLKVLVFETILANVIEFHTKNELNATLPDFN